MQAAIEWIIIVTVLTGILIGSFLYDADQRDQEVSIHARQMEKAVEEANAKLEALPPNFVLTPDGVIVTEDFRESSVVKFTDVELCQETAPQTLNYTPSYSCHENQCATLLDFGNKEIPDQVTVNRKYNGACVTQTLQDIRKYQIYTKDIVFSAMLIKHMGIMLDNSKVQRTANSKFTDVSVRKDGKNTFVTLEYLATRPQEDEFKADSKTVQVLYNLKSAH